ncbi:hypothetical protein BDD12DRAFT_862387 [Trichophaea hybrida]|nr:hypothetical protein BDD12DRAFT_862387 [Trichophaea hybrida]
MDIRNICFHPSILFFLGFYMAALTERVFFFTCIFSPHFFLWKGFFSWVFLRFCFFGYRYWCRWWW